MQVGTAARRWKLAAEAGGPESQFGAWRDTLRHARSAPNWVARIDRE